MKIETNESRSGGLGIAMAIVVPALLGADILLGGAANGDFLQAAALQIVACLMVAWCLLDSGMRRLSMSARVLIAIVAIACTYCLAQLVPLPHAVWATMPGRGPAVEAFGIAGIGDVSQPMSLRPDRTLYGLMRVLPPLAIFLLVAKMPWRVAGQALPWTIIGLAAFSAVLGIAQTFFPNQLVLLPFGDPNGGGSPGIFQSPNHQATLQLIALPFVGMLFARVRNKIGLGDAYQASALALVGASVLLVTGLFLAGSLAGIVLLAPVLVASGAIAAGGAKAWHVALGLLFAIACAVGIGYLAFTSPWLSGLGISDLSDSPLGRKNVFELSWRLAMDHFPWGAGLGTFENVFPGYEDPATITSSFIAHVHNDYLEVLGELGVVGALALAGAVGWWIVLSVRAWRTSADEGGRIKQAASIALGVVVLHSLVDFPARTEAIACLAAVCAGLMSGGTRGGGGQSRNTGEHGPFQHKHVDL